MYCVYDELIRHAPQRVEDYVAEKASLEVPKGEVVDENLDHVVEEVE